MNENSIKLIKNSCCFHMGGSRASCLLKLFVAWSGLRHSFYHVLEEGQPSSFCSLLAVGQIYVVSLHCELTLHVLFWGVEWIELPFWFSTSLLAGGRIVRVTKHEKLDWTSLFLNFWVRKNRDNLVLQVLCPVWWDISITISVIKGLGVCSCTLGTVCRVVALGDIYHTTDPHYVTQCADA